MFYYGISYLKGVVPDVLVFQGGWKYEDLSCSGIFLWEKSTSFESYSFRLSPIVLLVTLILHLLSDSCGVRHKALGFSEFLR